MFDRIRRSVGIGRSENELYDRAYEKGVSMSDFIKAAELFNDATRRATENGNTALASQASANAHLYRYLATKQSEHLAPLMKALDGLAQIECIGLRQEFMPVDPLRIEIDARMVEATIEQAGNDVVRLRDLHKLASEKFQLLLRNPLITYEYVPSDKGHNEKADERFFFHDGFYHFYDAMTKKDSDPAAASDDLSLATLAFRRANDEIRLQRMATLLEHWRSSRSCYLCHRKVQGYELHFSLYTTTLTPYIKRLLEDNKEDISALSMETGKIAVCTPCGSMISLRATEEADKVRRELTAKLNEAMNDIRDLRKRIGRLESKP